MTSPPKPFPFLHLPPEIRTQIYTHLLTPPAPIPLHSLLLGLRLHAIFPTHRRPCTSILLVSHQLHAEALPIFWANTCFRLDTRAIRLLLGLLNGQLRWGQRNAAEIGRDVTEALDGGMDAGRVRRILGQARRFQYRVGCEVATHKGVLGEGVGCVHVGFEAVADLREIVRMFFKGGGEEGRKLDVVLEVRERDVYASSRSYEIRAYEVRLLYGFEKLVVDFDHSALRKLNYRSGNPPWGEGDTLDVVAGNLRGLGKKHSVELSLHHVPAPSSAMKKRAEFPSRAELTATLMQRMGRSKSASETRTPQSESET